MKKYFKIGFGLTSGYLVAKAVIQALSRWAITRLRKSKDIMEATKKYDPKLYESIRNF